MAWYVSNSSKKERRSSLLQLQQLITTKHTKMLSISFNSGTLIKLDNLIMSKTTYIMATVVLSDDDLLPCRLVSKIGWNSFCSSIILFLIHFHAVLKYSKVGALHFHLKQKKIKYIFLEGEMHKKPYELKWLHFIEWFFFLWFPLGNYEKKSCLHKLKFWEASRKKKKKHMLKISYVYLIGNP